MALDGITISAIAKELKDNLLTGRITKIAQPEADELLLTIKVIGKQYRLDISSGATLPLIYLTEDNKISPLTAPNFCMLLRKHLNNAKIIDIYQPGLERIINFEIEHYDEMGDLKRKLLIVELMGKHSNIIFTDMDGKIIDSIKRISANISSIREVLPGKNYFIPMSTDKLNPLLVNKELFISKIKGMAMPVAKSILASFTGISPIIAEEICYNANIDSQLGSNLLNEIDLDGLYNSFSNIIDIIKSKSYSPNIIYENNIPKEFNTFPLSIYSNAVIKNYDSVSSMLCDFYKEKDSITRIRQKSADLRKIATTALEKDYKKYDLQQKQLNDTQKKDKFKIYGEMINTYGYSVEADATSFTCNNYYTGEDITIPLDNTISVMDNSKKYFEKYNKLKRTAAALGDIVIETKDEISHLESILNSIDIATHEDDLKEIKEEMILSGYIRRKSGEKKVKYKSKPFHYISSDGFHMYVGKNNIQNDELTFKFANGGDWWFHSKTFPGSHVIVKTEGQKLPDKTFEEAAQLAAYYSKGKDQDKVLIDYVERKQVKKVAGAKPGFVIYHTNYSMAIAPDISSITLVD